MADETRGAGSVNASETSLEAQVNAPALILVPLYKLDGQTVSVPEAAVEALIADGWSRESNDIDELRGQIDLLFGSARGAVDAYAAEASQAEALTTGVESAIFVAERAMEDVIIAWGRLHRAVQAKLAVDQTHGGVAMRVTKDDPWNKTGDVVQIDESQIDYYRDSRGYELVANEGASHD